TSFVMLIMLLSAIVPGAPYTDISEHILLSQTATCEITSLSSSHANVGDTIIINGHGFGTTQGSIVITGLCITPTSWSDTEVYCTIPNDAATGFLYIRTIDEIRSNTVSFTIDRFLLEHQIEPVGLTLEETGLLGSAYLVETDGDYLYGITGFETLCTYKIYDEASYELMSIRSLPQRVGDIKLHNGYLYISGDHGLYIFKTQDLQQGTTTPIASLAGGSYISLDIKEKTSEPIQGTILALCEYVPTIDLGYLTVPLYQFKSEELTYLGSYKQQVISTERHHAIAIDPLNPKVYVSGFKTLLGDDKYILEIDISDPFLPQLNHREETAGLLGFDMEARDDILWMGILSEGTELFRTYRLKSGQDHFLLEGTVHGVYGLGRTTRIKIINDQHTVGVAWAGARPDVYLLDTFHSGSTPLASISSIDWAFDVTGYALDTDEYTGKIIVADEWGGFLTYDYTSKPTPAITHQQDYHWAPSAAMIENLYLTEERIYAANRGAGIWSADRNTISDETLWRHSEWDWNLEDPQPYPVSALCVRDDPTYGTLIAARGNNKAMAWGSTLYGILYKETQTSIQQLAISSSFDPPSGLLSGSPGLSVIWPETDIVYMATGTDGLRAFIVNPEEPSITLHTDCIDTGFARSHFGTNRTVSDIHYYKTGGEQKMVIASTLAPFVNEPTITIFDITYPEGLPDRNNPQRTIHLTYENALQCLLGRSITYFDMTSSGMIAVATSLGIAVFHISWIPQLNEMSTSQAWNLIKIPESTYQPYWDSSNSQVLQDVCFGDENTLYAVKQPQGKNHGGVYRIDIEILWEGYTHECTTQGFYPGVQCGMDYNNLLQGWGNPDITTLHHPYALIAEGNTVYVTGWSGKIDRLSFNQDNQPPVSPTIQGPSNGKFGTTYSYSFTSTDPEGGDIFYYIEWGDGQIKDWVGPYPSGTKVIIDHSWSRQGSFTLRAKAKDSDGRVSDWGNLEISMPRNSKYLINNWLRIFFQRMVLFENNI
ncbi:MAG: IPT/TIG domain-containing protein, partial [Thermoplasmatota archaeon]